MQSVPMISKVGGGASHGSHGGGCGYGVKQTEMMLFQ